MVSKLLFVFVLSAFSAATTTASSWRYGEEEHWPELCKVGQKQSPIALSEDDVEEVDFEPLVFKKYNTEYIGHLKNNRHSVEVRLNQPHSNRPSVTGGNLNSTYVLDHLHFHWQSEHTIGDMRYPLELHLVHYDNRVDSLNDALRYKNGVAVFSVLFYISPEDETDFQPIFDIFNQIKDSDQNIPIAGFVVSNFMPRDTAGYYRYEGSLTTPGCTEGLVWTVFTNKLPISERQVRLFESLQVDSSTRMVANYRSLQARNDRKIQLKRSPLYGGATSLKHFSIFVFMMITGFLLL